MVVDLIRKLDLYKKVPHDLKKGTVSGAVISVICVLLTVYLVLAELVLYSNGSLKTSIFVSYNNQEEDVLVRLNMTIIDKLCEDVIIIVKNSHGHPQENNPNLMHTQRKENCNLYGHLTVKKTPGVILILPNPNTEERYEYTIEKSNITVTKSDMDHIETSKGWTPPMDYKPPEGFKIVKKPKNVMMNHIFHYLEFGEAFPVKRRWNELLSTESKPFSALSRTNRTLPIRVGHDYHIKLVPTSFIDQNNMRVDAFQYSYAYQNIMMMTPRGIAPPSIILRYEVSAMEIKYQYTRKPIYHLLTMLCAIVGGIVTVAGIIDKILFSAQQVMIKKIELGKQG